MENHFLKNMQLPKVDVEAMMASHRKNIEALSKAQKSAFEAAKNVSEAHQNYLSKAFTDMKTHFKELSDAKTVEEKIETHARRLKDSFEMAMSHGSAVSQTCAKARKEATDALHARMKEGAEEAKKMAQKTRDAVAKATKH